MGIDAGWHARKPGLVPPALVRAAVEKAEALCAPLTLTMSEDFGEYGGFADVDCADYGPISLYQPEDDDEEVSIGISTSTGASREDFDTIFAVADAIAQSLGCVFDDADALDELREEAERREKAKDAVDVRSVRMEIGLAGSLAHGPLAPRVVSIEARPLASVRGDELEELEQRMLRAVAWALERSSQPGQRPTVDELVVWLDGHYVEIERPTESSVWIRPADDEDGYVVSLRLRDDWADVTFWPEVELEPRRALEANERNTVVASLALDADGDWVLRTTAPNRNLSAAVLVAWIDELYRDIDRIFAIAREDDDEGEDEEADEDEGDSDDDEA